MGWLEKIGQLLNRGKAEIAPELLPASKSASAPWPIGKTRRIPNTDPVLQAKQGTALPGYQYEGGLYRDYYDHDPELQSFYEQRRAAITAAPMRIRPSSDTPPALEVAEFVRYCLFDLISAADGDTGFRRDVGELHEAVMFATAISEVQYQRLDVKFPKPGTKSGHWTKNGAMVPFRLKSRNPADFAFSSEGELLICERGSYEGKLAPTGHFLVFRPYTRFENPYGFGKMQTVYWYAWFKRVLLEWKLRQRERYGDPATFFELPEVSLSAEDIARLQDLVNNMHRETGGVLPNGVKPHLIESSNITNVEQADWLIKMCNDGMAKNIIGQTLTSDPGESGSQSLGEVQERVAKEIRDQDARAIEALVNSTLVRWLVDLNYPGAPPPVFEIDTSAPKDLVNDATVLQSVSAVIQAQSDGQFWVPPDWIAQHFALRIEKVPPDIQAARLKQTELQAKAQQPVDTRPAYDKAQNPRRPRNNSSTGKQARQANTP